MVAGKVSMTDNLRRKGIASNITDMCSMCGREREAVNHLFLFVRSSRSFRTISLGSVGCDSVSCSLYDLVDA